MRTLIHKALVIVSKDTVTSKEKGKTDFLENIESNRFRIIPILLVIISCIRGITASYATLLYLLATISLRF